MKSNPTMIPGCPEGQDARVLAERARASMAEDRVLVHVALDDARVAVLTELLAFFAPDVAVICFPAWDCLPYDRVSPNPEIVAARVSALTQLIVWEGEKRRYPRVLLTTVNAITQKVTPKGPLSASSFTAEAGRRLDPAALQSYLSRNGYSRTDTVREHGEYAVRGGIIDVYPSGYLNPIRIDLFGDEIEAIKEFDPVTQRTGRSLEHFSLTQAMEFTLDDESIARFRSGYRDLFGVPRSEDPLYAAVSEGRRYNGMDHWLPLFFDSMDTLLDYTPGAAITMDHDVPQACSERAAQVADFYQARKTLAAAGTDRKKSKDVSLSGSVYHPLPVVHLYVVEENWMDGAAVLSPFVALEEELTVSGARKGRDFGDIRALPGGDVFGAVKEYVGVRQGAGCQILIAAYSEGSKERLKGLLDHAGIENLKDCGFYEDVKKLKSGQIGITVLALERGFVAPDLTVMTEQDILGDRLARKAQKRKKADNFLTEVSSLAPGDLVVHMEHGVGRFEGLETLAVGKMLHDCLKIVYAGEDKLFVPVENIEVLSRFGSDEGAVPLDKLGGAGWQARKAKVKKDLMRIADHLLKIAAARTLRDGEKLPVNDNYEDFAAHFPYDETEDQQRAIAAVLEDLDKGHPMDRLVCGDVGFGKTEVALRAAYVAAMNGVQVAVVVPTTLLARQHFKNFFSRFQGTGLRVEQLSRMVAPRDADKVRQGLKDGSINIVVGTHALFAKGMGFADLGLLIVDEEQRFGVKQKERLKELKENVHVLTLTATPIPRTLQMSLTGVKEMSLIATPPVDRLAVRTFVLPFDPMVVREALMRERHRGGQSFYVCPRVKDLGDVEERLKALVPELKIVTAHGQLPSTDLEDRMTAFYDGQYDILLATNIIESGIDIPTANTMIVHRAEMFGLAQLYQIRGRIGRSKLRGYAYLTYDPGKKLTDQAMKRLEVIETLDTLGAGFQLASHDMDIRGAGNLLGEEQSGHIREVGVELYQQMLEEAVAAAREGLDWEGGEVAEEKWSPQINVGMSVLIPDGYVEDLNVRMSLYRRLSELHDKEAIEAFAAELIDRFGPIPEEVENLLQIVEIKQLCKQAGVDRVEAGPKGAVIGFYKDTPPHIPALMGWMQEKGGALKLRPDQKLVAIRQWDTPAQRVKGVRSLMREMACLV